MAKYVRVEACLQEHPFQYFNSEGHNGLWDDVSIILIDKTDGKNPNEREHNWRHTLHLLAPHDLNDEDDFEVIICFYLYFTGSMYWPITYYCKFNFIVVIFAVIIFPYDG